MKVENILETVPNLNQPGLILLAARPGMGKTSFAMSLVQAAARKRAVAVFSLDMSREQLIVRFFSTMDPSENDRIYIDDNPALSMSDIYAKCRQLDNLGLVVIDYLQLMFRNRDEENRQQVITEISQALKAMANELSIPVLCLSQLGRSIEAREDKRPTLSDIGESAVVAQGADIVLFLYRDDYYNENSDKQEAVEVNIEKNLFAPNTV